MGRRCRAVGSYENLGGSSNARPFESEDFTHIPAKESFFGEGDCPLVPGSDGTTVVQVLSSRAFGR